MMSRIVVKNLPNGVSTSRFIEPEIMIDVIINNFSDDRIKAAATVQ